MEHEKSYFTLTSIIFLNYLCIFYLDTHNYRSRKILPEHDFSLTVWKMHVFIGQAVSTDDCIVSLKIVIAFRD